jgi:hypothetical protein
VEPGLLRRQARDGADRRRDRQRADGVTRTRRSPRRSRSIRG